MDLVIGIGIVVSILTGLGLIFAAVRWVIKAVKEASFDNGKHDAKHEKIEVQMDSAHDKLRKQEARITKVESHVSNVDGKLDTLIANQQTIIAALTKGS